MVDREVEDTLREIRERVLSESTHAVAESRPAADVQGLATSAGNGAAHLMHADGRAGESLARLQANLATTERAWSRLPPLMSNRRGRTARLELWMKRQIKRAAHWFTWEQVNFNSAVHHALGDVRDALGDTRETLTMQGHALAQAQSDIAALHASLRDSLEHLRSESEADRARASELRARLAAAESRFDSRLAELRRALDAGVEQLRAEQRAHTDGLRAERDARIHAREEQFQNEMRERVEHLLEEQRVCFKQLSLEAGESAAMQERARRQIEARLEALEKERLEQ
ncbi:MAG: hypothetical protein H7Z38_02710 [Rubrivivax sp.]|nr:hypothetical protein [Pyrinomonadaceae bacterium]